jgi:hypothetical protein
LLDAGADAADDVDVEVDVETIGIPRLRSIRQVRLAQALALPVEVDHRTKALLLLLLVCCTASSSSLLLLIGSIFLHQRASESLSFNVVCEFYVIECNAEREGLFVFLDVI